MPWTSRASRNRRWRLRRDARRWAYDHSEHLVSLSIGAAVVGAIAVIVLAWRLFG